jgi:DNA-binding protein HU-beta
MTKAELVAAVSERAGISRVQAKDALDAVLDTITDVLSQGEPVRLVGFGAFRPIARPAGMAWNPKTGEAVKRPASKTCRFQVGEALKSALN